MSFIKLDQLPEVSQKYTQNKWADFIELKCIDNIDGEISLNDIVQIDANENFSEMIDEESPSEKTTNQHCRFVEIFTYIKFRSKILGQFYPFEYTDNYIIKLSPLTHDNLLYIYLLLSSNTKYLDRALASKFTNYFERLSLKIMHILYPNFRNELFGTSTVPGDCFHGGTLHEKLIKLSKCINTNMTRKEENNPRNSWGSGDRGIDVISFFQPDFDTCNASYIPVNVGQCSCSYDEWENKQSSISNKMIQNIFEDFATCLEFMFIPFPLRSASGNWADEDFPYIGTIVIDRFRFFSIIAKSNKITPELIITNDIKDYLKNVSEKLYVAS